MHTYARAWVHMCANICAGQRSSWSIFPGQCPPCLLFFRTASLFYLELAYLAVLAGQKAWGSACLCFPRTGTVMCVFFYMSLGDWTYSGPHTCVASIFSTEPSPQPCFLVFNSTLLLHCGAWFTMWNVWIWGDEEAWFGIVGRNHTRGTELLPCCLDVASI